MHVRGTVFRATGWALAVALAAGLAGCGDSGQSAKTEFYRLKEINRFAPKAGSADLQKISRQAFLYQASSNPDRTILYSGSGADTLWGTADDVIAYYVTCAYSGKAATQPLDLETEIRDGLAGLYSSHTAAMTGIGLDELARSCAINYNKQGALAMKVYSAAGADAVWQNADDTLLLSVDWKQPGTSGDASVAVTAPGIPAYAGATLAHYYYGSLSGAERDLVRTGSYYAFTLDGSGRLTRRSRYNFAGNPGAWPGPQAGDVRLDYTQFQYSTDELLKCTRNDAETALSLVRDAYQNNFLNLRQTFSAGVDGVSCTNDDVLTLTDGFVFEKI